MKIQCDVCSKEEASVFCCADEAALCGVCDRRVHRANKLAGKHRRLPLLLPSSTTAAASAQPHPLCDICQEKRGFVFCKEDRAILCKDCDAPIHTANHLTMKHSRFLLTGARLSSAPIPSSSSSSPPPEPEAEHSTNNHGATAPKTHNHHAPAVAATTNSSISSGRSISEYLIKMLPGWRVEDLLVDDATTTAVADGTHKMDAVPAFLEADLEDNWPGASPEELPMWVPHVPQILLSDRPAASFGGSAFFRQGFVPSHPILGRDQWVDEAFTVPQINLVSGNSKRPRGF